MSTRKSSRLPTALTVVGWILLLILGLVLCFAGAAVGDPLPPTTQTAAPFTLPTTRPAQVPVWLQPKRTLATWAARGCTLAIGRDRESNADGSDGVTLAEWKAACRAAGLRYVIDPSADPAADAADPSLAGFLLDNGREVDNVIVDLQDANKDPIASAAAQEAYYTSLDAAYAGLKKLAPNVPVYLTIDVNQFQYHRPDYTRLFKACDAITGDYYPVQRAMPVGEYGRLLDLIRQWPGGNKLRVAWVETSYQHLNPLYFHGGRGPTLGEWSAEVQLVLDRGLWPGWFPQCLGEDRLAPFSVDATTPEIAAAMVAWLKPSVGGVGASGGSSTQPAADPFAGTVITLPNGKSYVLQPR